MARFLGTCGFPMVANSQTACEAGLSDTAAVLWRWKQPLPHTGTQHVHPHTLLKGTHTPHAHRHQQIPLADRCPVVQSKVRELEEKCRVQSEQFNLLSRDLEKFRQHTGNIDLLGGSSVALLDVPLAPGKPFPQYMNGLATSIHKGKRQMFETVGGGCLWLSMRTYYSRTKDNPGCSCPYSFIEWLGCSHSLCIWGGMLCGCAGAHACVSA